MTPLGKLKTVLHPICKRLFFGGGERLKEKIIGLGFFLMECKYEPSSVRDLQNKKISLPDNTSLESSSVKPKIKQKHERKKKRERTVLLLR